MAETQAFKFPDEIEAEEKFEVEKEPEQQIDIEIEDDTPAEDRGRKPADPEKVKALEVEVDDLDKYSKEAKDKLIKMKRVWNDERRRAEAAESALDGRATSLESRMGSAEGNIGYLAGNTIYRSAFVTRQSPTGAIDGSNTDFTLALSPMLNSESVFLNGLLQEPGVGNDYTIVDNTITFSVAPVVGDRIRVSYIVSYNP